MKKFLLGFVHGGRGVCQAAKERNMRVHAMIALSVIACGILFRITITEWIELLFAMGLVFSAETFNTAIENVVNLIRDDCGVPYENQKLRNAKDLAAGAVLIAAIAAALIGLSIFLPILL